MLTTITTAANEILSTTKVKSISAFWSLVRSHRDNIPNIVGCNATVTDEAGNTVLKIEFVATKAGKIQFKTLTAAKETQKASTIEDGNNHSSPKKAAAKKIKAVVRPKRTEEKFLGNPFYNWKTGKSELPSESKMVF